MQRNPRLGPARWEGEVRRHDTEHLAGDAVDLDRAADDGGIAREPSLPQRVAQHHPRIKPLPIVSHTERASEFGAGAKDVISSAETRTVSRRNGSPRPVTLY